LTDAATVTRYVRDFKETASKSTAVSCVTRYVRELKKKLIL